MRKKHRRGVFVSSDQQRPKESRGLSVVNLLRSFDQRGEALCLSAVRQKSADDRGLRRRVEGSGRAFIRLACGVDRVSAVKNFRGEWVR